MTRCTSTASNILMIVHPLAQYRNCPLVAVANTEVSVRIAPEVTMTMSVNYLRETTGRS
ncbi:hypothetical protein DPMN_163911 [Dreissena polymorpha]|uniref:Uncharacterized protein n=1 Tax=Dreissena polymorpha TaxID=45954 RepID=A0A9D4ET41_DREPO|nr:hypothetical protein DPMN_163911 [Dreissena polymorpha]